MFYGGARARNLNEWGASRKSVNYGRFAQTWSKKSIFEEGKDIRGASRKSVKYGALRARMLSIHGRFAQECFYGGARARNSNGWGASRQSVNYGRFEQTWSKKSIFEGGTDIRGASRRSVRLWGASRRHPKAPRMYIPPSMSDFFDHFLAKRPIIETFLREALHLFDDLAQSAPTV